MHQNRSVNIAHSYGKTNCLSDVALELVNQSYIRQAHWYTFAACPMRIAYMARVTLRGVLNRKHAKCHMPTSFCIREACLHFAYHLDTHVRFRPSYHPMIVSQHIDMHGRS